MKTNLNLTYPDLPVAREKEAILDAMEKHQVVVVVGDTGSGKTTQLPKMAIEFAARHNIERGRVGCTQPRRIAAASVAQRVAEEMGTTIGQIVGYQVRFQERVSRETALKFMTDGILLAETQGDPSLKQYHTLIIDEAHERSLNIDFLLGYLKRLIKKRKDLKILVSSATLDAGGFANFFDQCPIVEVEGRTFPVEVENLPPQDGEELSRHVARAVEQISQYDEQGDILVFLPGEREIRDCTDMLEGRKYRATDICPLFARLGLGDQQKIFNPVRGRRRIVLATNVAETSLTIPGIIYVIDSGLARVSRWNPGRQIQRLQIEPVSQASARQRKGRCGRVTEGICVQLYDEEDFLSRPEFTDPEIRRSSLAGVILRMKSLGLPEISDFPFLDPPKDSNISEGYRTLREIGALDKHKALTDIGRKLAKLPVEPRLGRMLITAAETGCLGPVLIIVSGLTVMDPKERPADKKDAADKAHGQWNDEDSDFISILHIWDDLLEFRDGKKWKNNRLRKFCKQNFLNFRRVMEWDNLRRELGQLGRKQLTWNWQEFDGHHVESGEYQLIHEAIFSGVPRQFGLIDTESKDYKSATGGKFAIFPASGLFGKKKPDWLLAFEMVDTTRLWARRVARIDPAWVENVAPHLCRSRYHSAYWNKKQGAVYAKEVVVCGGLNIVQDRRVHYGRIDPEEARQIFIRDALLGDGLIKEPAFLKRIKELKDEVHLMEQKTRRVGGLWHDDAIFQFLDSKIPEGMCTAKAFHRWMREEANKEALMPTLEDVIYEDPSEFDLEHFPDFLEHGNAKYPLHYRHAPGEPDDGITIELALSELPGFPEWLPGWGVWGDLEGRVMLLIRSLPKALRIACQPVADTAADFVAAWADWVPAQSLYTELAGFIRERTNQEITEQDFDLSKIPDPLITKIWVYDDETGEEITISDDIVALKAQLKSKVADQFDSSVGADWVMTGHRVWDFPDLPREIPAGGLTGYPGLIDEKQSVGLKLWLNRDRAIESHEKGCGRLFLLRFPDLKKYVLKNPPMEIDTRMMLPLFGATGVNNEDFCLLAAVGTLSPEMPRAAESFEKAAEAGRSLYYECAAKLGAWLDQAVASYSGISAFVEENRESESFGESVADIEQQLAWLLRKDFLLEAGWKRISDYPRYFKAIEERILRMQSQPLVKDLDKMDRIIPFRDDWKYLLDENADDLSIRNLGYAIEELRVSLFAPGIPTGMKISEIRLAKLFEPHLSCESNEN
ncbi:MAG: ATP-dependent RNA helicase HrpA [Verrucomicrobiales bacterium]|nr:ATP-dependent RNA helicase HrpA [Verrucomicrobiales bacterium]